MIETHPFGSFVPKKTSYLLLGSFTARQAVAGPERNSYDWFYTTKRNQFWPILEKVYGASLGNKSDKLKLFENLGIAITDIILQCERKADSNLDTNLTNIVFNIQVISNIIQKNNVKTIFFSSRFVEHLFRSRFKHIIDLYPKTRLVTLPSPSPRFARMSKGQKIARYRKLLPKLNK